MSNTLTKPSVSKADLEALRKQVQDQMRQMEALIQQLNTALADSPRRPRSSPLDDIKEVMQATQDLRVGNGNISAERVAKLFGVSLSELANWLGRSRQAVSKTPDADSLQPSLGFFERVARLRVVVKADEAFRKWFQEYHNVDDAIYRIEEEIDFATDQEIEEKKLRRAWLKDRIYNAAKRAGAAVPLPAA